VKTWPSSHWYIISSVGILSTTLKVRVSISDDQIHHLMMVVEDKYR